MDEYGDKYSDFIGFRRENGILEVRVHTNDAEFEWSLEAHRGIIPAMFDVNNDPENECIVLTGTGDEFLARFLQESWVKHGFDRPFSSYHGYDTLLRPDT